MKKIYFLLLATILLTGYAGYSQPNDDCSGAITINCGQTINSTTVGAGTDVVPTCVTTLGSAPGIWYTFVGDGTTVTLSMCGSSYDTKIGVFTGTCGAFVCVTGNDDFCGLQSQVSFPAVLGTTYYILATGFSTNSGTFSLTRTCAAAASNDLCTGAVDIACGQTITGSTAAATVDAATPTCVTTLNSANGVWYKFTGDGSNVTLSMCGSSYDTKIGVFTGTCAALTCVTGNDDFCGLQSQVSFTATAGTQYYIIVTGFSTASGNYTLTRSCIPPNDLCANAINIACGQTINATTVGATADVAPTCTGTTNPGIWYSFVGVGGIETLSTCAGASFDTKLSVYTGACGALTCIAGNDDFCGLQSQVSFATTPGTTYRILVHGFGGATGTFSLTRTCPPPCAGVPSPGAITGPAAAVCAGATVNLSLGGYTNASGLTFQWKSSAVAGGPYLPIAGATNTTYSFTAAATAYYIVTVTCNNPGGGAGNTVEFPVNVSKLVHSNVLATPGVVCSPGTTVITATVSGSAVAGNYTHTLTGAGTIGAAVVSGANNSNVSFTITNIPAGAQTYTLTSTDAAGCTVVSPVSVTVNETPVVTITTTPATVCVGGIIRLDASATPALPQTFTSLANTHIPAGGTTVGTSLPYPNAINISGIGAPNATVKSVTLSNYSHTLPDDVDIVLVSPGGQAVILMSDAGGSTAATGQTFVFDDAAATTLADNAFNPSGTYKPTNYGAGDTWPAPGPLGAPTSTTLSTFSGPVNGNWSLYVVDDQLNEIGFIATWSITFNVPSAVVFSPVTNLFTDAAATIPYTGTPVYTVWAKPPVNTTYTGTTTVNGCTGQATVLVSLLQPPVITVQPSPATRTVCPGFNVSWTVTATGAGLTYQWRKNGVNLINAGFISGVNTNTLTIATIGASDAGSYDVVVSGTCSPAATSTAAVLVIGTPASITTQPTNQVVCVGTNAVFSVVAGGAPTPTIFQWQSSPDGVVWTDLTTGGSYTSTLTVPNPTAANNNLRYRVRITNPCGGGFLFSNVVTLTVNPLVPGVATDLFNRTICLSDTLVPLVGTPVGGSWSGPGVSGFNFVPAATGVGTYILTYTYTGNAGTGCTVTDTTKVIVTDCGERIRTLTDDDAIILYPNPNNGRFFVRINTSLYNYLGMKVYNSTGMLVNGTTVNKVLTSPIYNGLTYGRVVPIDLSYLPAGVYIVKFYYDDGIRTSEKSFKVVMGHD